jgi:tetratricopeptide (TPR) repeat protein
MNHTRLFFWLTLFFVVSGNTLGAQETAVYRDQHDAFKRGMDFYREQLYGKARESFRAVLQQQPLGERDRAPIYRLTARLYDGLSALRLGRGDAEQALLAFIAENEPSDIANLAKSEIAGYYFVQKDYAKAAEYYRTVNLKGMDNDRILEVKFNLGYALFVEEKFDEASEYLGQVKDAKTTRFFYPANYYYGCSAFLTKKYTEAMESFTRVLESKEYGRTVPYHICQIHYRFAEYEKLIEFGEPLMGDEGLSYRNEMGLLIGQAYFQLENYDKALPYLQDFVNRDNKVAEDIMYQLAVSQMQTGDYRSAVPNFIQLSGTNSVIGQVANYNIGHCYAAMGNKGSALEAYRIAAEQHHDEDLREKACFEFAALGVEVNVIGDAVDLLNTIPENSVRYDMAQGMLGQILLASSDFERALTILRKLPNKTPKMRETLQKVAVKRGCQLWGDRKYAEAIPLFDEALQYPVDDDYTALAHYWKAESYYRSKKPGQAEQSFKAFLDATKKASGLPDNASRGMGHYGLGYVYLHQGQPDYKAAAAQFDKAADWFKEHLKSIKDLTVTNGIYMDALLQAGECYTGSGAYSKALVFYDALITSNYKFVPEARFGKARIYSAKNDDEKAIRLFESIIRDFPDSDLADNAQYELGAIYKNLNKFDLAAKAYTALLSRVPNSEFHNQALNDMGTISLNQNNPEKALEYFKQVVAHNPTPDECTSALDAIEQIYTERDQIDEYVTYRQTASCGGDPSTVEVEKLKFQAAAKLYNAGSYDKAIKAFDDFLVRFERSAYRINAMALRGDSYKELRQFEKALVNFDSVLRRAPNEFAAGVAFASGVICLDSTKNYPAAYSYFLQLEKYAENDKMRKNAYFGLLRSGDRFDRRDRTYELTKKILKLSGITDEEKGRALLYSGVHSARQKEFEQARLELTDAVKLCGVTEDGARARYELAYLYYTKRNLKEAEDWAKKVNAETPAYCHWLSKSFILRSDISIEKGENYLAKMPLETVIRKCPGEKELVEIAKAKIKKIEESEGETNKIQPNDPNKRIRVDD